MIKNQIAYRSRNLQIFVKEIQTVNRNPKDARVLELLSDEDTNPILYIGIGKVLYRSRIVKSCDEKKTNRQAMFCGFGKEDSFAAPPEATRDMRANYRYIPYLYCCTSTYLSIIESRPRIGASVSVARIVPKTTLKIFDLSMGIHSKSRRPYSAAKYNLLFDLSRMFSKPIASDDDTLDYVPTQYIAEYIKNLGYDGLGYKSSLHEFHQSGIEPINMVIFNYDKCEAVGSNLYQITDNTYSCEQIDFGEPNPVELID